MAKNEAKNKTEDKAPEATEAPAAEKKERAPRQDYGFLPGAKITLTDKENKYRGKRLEYYEILKKHNGKSIEDFFKACPQEDPPRGWLRFFVQDGAATLSGGSAPEPKPKAEKEAKEEEKEAPPAKAKAKK